MSHVRNTTRGLTQGTYIRVRNPVSRKHARGTFIAPIGDGTRIEYRSAFNGGVYPAPLANVSVDQKLDKRIKELRSVRT